MIVHDVSPHRDPDKRAWVPVQGKTQLREPERRRKRQRDTALAKQSLPRVVISRSF